MTRRLLFALFGLAAGLWSVPLHAQSDAEASLHETRAVWLTTVYGLDWPSGFSAERKQDAMREILDRSKELGINTVFFQVVFHGTAVYESERLPWSHLISGFPGRGQGWDPLAFAIEEARQRGLELHAWFNVFQMGNPRTPIDEDSEPQHVRFSHPEWVKAYESGGEVRDYWVNPGIPDARAWLVGHVVELVENYDIDGIHFDYIRYPGMGFDDDNKTKRDYPHGSTWTPIDDWRRENVNLFVRDAYAAVKTRKPWVKVGSAPIGTFKYYNGAPPGFWAWDHLFQDSRRWLEEGVHDYLAPQLYFDIGTEPDPGRSYASHDFAYWVDDWQDGSHGRHIYAGIGAWRETGNAGFDEGEIARQIIRSRQADVEGQTFFRYSFITSAPFGGGYDSKALPAPMEWDTTARAPTAPTDLAIAYVDSIGSIRLRWSASEGGALDPLRRYAIFRSEGAEPDVTQSGNLFAVLGPTDTTFTEAFDVRPDDHVYYTVVAQSQLGMTSASSEVVSTASTALPAEQETVPQALHIHDVYPNPAAQRATIGYTVDEAASVVLTVYDVMGRHVTTLHDGLQTPGTYQVPFDGADLASGVYLVELRGPHGRDVRRIVLAR